MTSVGWNYLVIAIAMVFEAGAWFVAWREFDRQRGAARSWRAVRQSKDPALFTVLFEDSAALLGLVVALLGVLASDKLGWLRADAVATIAIGCILAGAAVLLAIETKSLLIGEAASPALVDDIIGAAGRAAFVEAVNEARTLHFGPRDVLVNLSVDARDAMSAGEVEQGIARLEDDIKARHPEVSRVSSESRPRRPARRKSHGRHRRERLSQGTSMAGRAEIAEQRALIAPILGFLRAAGFFVGAFASSARPPALHDRAASGSAGNARGGAVVRRQGRRGRRGCRRRPPLAPAPERRMAMTHRSRPPASSSTAGPTRTLDAAAGFWSAALGAPRPREDGYVTLGDLAGLHPEVQLVDHPPRVHLDIESDDIPAEVARLEGLGAREVARIKTWVVMEAPTGHRFCVIRAQTPDFEAEAHSWP